MKTQKEENEEHGKECAALILLMKYGDKNAEGDLFILCKSRMYGFAWNLYRDRQEAEDACGECWEKCRDEIMKDEYKEGNCFTGFACKLIKNDFLMLVRKGIVFINLDSAEEIANTEREECFSKGMKALLNKLLSTYTVRMQDILWMVYIEGVPYKIVGRKYNITADSLRGEVSIVKRRLKRDLSLYDGDFFEEMDSSG